MAKQEISKLIERLESFEERAGIRLEALSAYLDVNQTGSAYDYVQAKVFGEVHGRQGTQLSSSVTITITAHDSNGRVIAKSDEHFNAETFFGFKPFEITLDVPTPKVSRLKIIVQKE